MNLDWLAGQGLESLAQYLTARCSREIYTRRISATPFMKDTVVEDILIRSLSIVSGSGSSVDLAPGMR